MKQDSTEQFSKWILAALTVALLAVLALIQYSPQDTVKIDLAQRDIATEQILMRPEMNSQALRFGFDLRGSPEEDARQYLPFLRYLEIETGLEFSLNFTAQSNDIIEELGTGKIHFAAIGAGAYLLAQSRYGISLVARGLNAQGRPECQSVIVVSPDSRIQDIEDLRGKRFAFGGESSTLGHLIPRIALAEHGLALDDLKEYAYTGSHQKCINVVASGQFDAGGLQKLLAGRVETQGLVRTIFTSEFYPSGGIVANQDVSPEIVRKVQQALIDFQPNGVHAKGLYHWERTEMAGGFDKANVEDYDNLRHWSIRLGLLDTTPEGVEQ